METPLFVGKRNEQTNIMLDLELTLNIHKL